MNRLKVTCCVSCLILLLMIFSGLVTQTVAWAVPEEIMSPPSLLPGQGSPPDEEIELDCQYPVLSSYAGIYFAYDVDLRYKGGEEPRVFDLSVEVPKGFDFRITPSYGEGTEIAAIRLEPGKTYGQTIKLTVGPSNPWLTPEPGEYTIILRASSGDIKNSIDLKAIVTAKFDIELTTTTGRLNTEATAGEDNYFSIVVTNTGSADLEKVIFNSTVRGTPSGWSVTFNPDKIDSLPVGVSREVEVNIKPAKKAIAGDYEVNISTQPESKDAFNSFDLRVTVLTPTIWGWVGVGIVVLVIAGLAVMFMRLGRR